MAKISVVINTYQEEANIEDAIKSASKVADEIVVVDTHSTDKTVELSKKLGAIVYLHDYPGYVEPARNFAIAKATGDWIMILDADERISDSLAKAIKKQVTEGVNDYFTIPRKNIIFGKWIKNARWWPDYNVRLFRQGHVEWDNAIHSIPTTTGKGGDFEASESQALTHYHYTSVDQFITRLNRYTGIQAKNLISGGYVFKWHDLIIKPANEFLSRYFAGKGYSDGIHGLALSGLQAFSEFVVYLKVWQDKGFKEEEVNVVEVIGQINTSIRDFNYWKADTLITQKGGIKHVIKRKFKLH